MATRGVNAAAAATRRPRASAAGRKARLAPVRTGDAGVGGALSSGDTPPPSAGEGARKAAKPRPVKTTIVPEKINTSPEPGTWRIANLREGQCRFACTADTVPAEAHRFCGEPVAWRGGKPTSWCGAHLDRVCGAPGRAAGGASVADVAAGRVVRDEPPPARRGWGSTGA